MPNAEDLIAPCGLYCGACPFHKGEIADLSRDLRKKLREAHFDRVAATIPFKAFKDYATCYETLGALVKLRCRRGCRGGGPPCNIKECAARRGYDGCWECATFATCAKLNKRLSRVHGNAYLKNLRTLAKVGKEKFLRGQPSWSG